MSRIAVKQEVMRWAVERSGLTVQQLEYKFPAIHKWTAGESRPTPRQLESLAKATLTPLGFFFLDTPPEERLPVPHFRTLGDRRPRPPSPDLLETIQMMQQRQAWMRDFLIEQGHEPLALVRSGSLKERPESIAQRMRCALGLDENWAAQQSTWTDALRTLREAMENAGVLVVINGIVGNNTHRKLDTGEFRGFVLVDEYSPLVFINGADGKAAQMFTLAHELAHVFFGRSAAFDLREMLPANEPTEQACNRAAAEFLVPAHELRQAWPSFQNVPERFQEIARRFKVSDLVAARRALDLHMINRKAFAAFYHRYKTEQRHRASHQAGGGDFYANQNMRVGRRFGFAVVRAAREGRLLYSDAYYLTGLYGRTFDKFATAILKEQDS